MTKPMTPCMPTSLLRRVSLAICLLFSGLTLPAQAIWGGYEWINPDADYVKIVIKTEGIYRISAASLLAQQASFQGLDIRYFHLYLRGEEVPMHISNATGDFILESTDFIEFYGNRNDGSTDAFMYRDAYTGVYAPGEQPNANYSTYTDEAAYFLTWNNDALGLRFQETITAPGSYIGLTPAPSFRHQVYREFVTAFNSGSSTDFDPNFAFNSNWTTGKGYTSANITTTSPASATTFSVLTPYPAAVPTTQPALRFRFSGNTFVQHITRLRFGTAQTDINRQNVTIETHSLAGNHAELSSGNVTVSAIPLNGSSDIIRYQWFDVQYDRQFRFDGGSFVSIYNWVNTTAGNTYLRFQGLNLAADDSTFIYDLTRNTRTRGIVTQGAVADRDTLHTFLTNAALGDHRLFVAARSSMVSTPTRIEAVTIPGSFLPDAGAEYVIIAPAAFRESALAFAQYRDTATTNNMASAKVFITEDLYNEFGYGSLTPLAIKRFIKTALDTWTVKPRYFMLWGKAYLLPRTPSISALPMVPTWGSPASDQLFVSDFDPNSRYYIPVVPIGRINITSNTQGNNYLAKVNDYEHTPFASWMKKGIHLGGGEDASEQANIGSVFTSFLNPAKLAAPLYGNVYYNQKTSSDIIQTGGVDLKSEFDNGCAILTFIGHSARNIFDIEIEEPANYNNFGKYPIILANGCYAGDFTSGSISFGERFITEPGKGAIAYIAIPAEGFISLMSQQSETLYQQLFKDSVGVSLGHCIQAGISSFLAVNGSNATAIYHAQQYNLQGDPAIIPYHPKKPDLVASASSFSFEPAVLTSQLESFTVNITVNNEGLATEDSFDVSLQQITGTGEFVNYPPVRVKLTGASTTIPFIVRSSDVNLSGGSSRFILSLDPGLAISELSETNNTYDLVKEILTDFPSILYPWQFARIDKDTVTLQVALYDTRQQGPVSYEFQLGTDPTYASVLASSGTINGTSYYGGWRYPGNLSDGQTYYWRARKVGSNSWATASFRYRIGGIMGWQQNQPAQLQQNALEQLQANGQELAFSRAAFDLNLYSNAGAPNGVLRREINRNGASISEQGFREAGRGLYYAIFDTLTGGLLSPNNSDGFGNVDALPTVAVGVVDTNAFKTLLDTLAPGHMIALVGTNAYGITWSTISESFKSKLRSIGITRLLTHTRNIHFLALGIKGMAPGQAYEALGTRTTDTINIDTRGFLNATFPSGTITSPIIGPASSWGALSWSWSTIDGATPGDNASLTLTAIRADGSDSTFVAALPESSNYSLASLSAAAFPFLRISVALEDQPNRTPPQPDLFEATYTPLPDITLDAITDYQFQSASVPEGQPLSSQIRVRNIGALPIDSTWATFRVVGQNVTNGVGVDTVRVPPLAPGASYLAQASFNSLNLGGSNTLTVTANDAPRQPEQYRFNNTFSQAFTVEGDNINPALDITFDGRRIINGDIVAPQPVINIELRDENEYKALTDTQRIEVFLAKNEPGINPISNRIAYASGPGQLTFTPATLPANKAQVQFIPNTLEDGEYILTVRAQDASGNYSGEDNYAIEFEVENESRLTQIINYPNPFSTSTRFVYTLTGSVLPEVFELHIYTVSGKLVKRIDLVELGEVVVGQNYETNYAWDGRDDFGDQLATGTYLYRTIIRMPGNAELKLDGSQTSQYFQKGWGKMVILR